MREFSVRASGTVFSVVQDDDGKFIIPEKIRAMMTRGTALKPAYEPIILARKPLVGTVAANVLAHGTGALNIDGCRVATDGETIHTPQSDPAKRAGVVGSDLGISRAHGDKFRAAQAASIERTNNLGRWPANIIHDGSEEVVGAFPDAPGQQQDIDPNAPSPKTSRVYGKMNREGEASAGRRYTDEGGTNFAALPGQRRGDSGSAARFFYSAKADADDRIGSKHPTVKPIDLMRWLCRLITPPGGTILDCFAGTGTTGEAAFYEGFNAILIEREPEYQADIARRMSLVMAGPEERKRTIIAEKAKGKSVDAGPLFDLPHTEAGAVG